MKKFFKKLGDAVINPSPRGKVRWMFTGILALTLISAVIVYPQGYNQVVGAINGVLPESAQIGLKEESEFSLGLDLKGGAHLVYQANLTEEDLEQTTQTGTNTLGQSTQTQVTTSAEAMERLRDRIERRVNALGVSEPLIQVSGQDRLVVEIAGVDAQTAIARIGETPVLEFRIPNSEPQRELTEEEQSRINEFNAGQLEKANGALTRARSGVESFEDLARELSEDQATAENGGELGIVTNDNYPGLLEAVESTLIGRVANNVIELENNYAVVRIDDRQERGQEIMVSHILVCYEGSLACGVNNAPTRSEAEEEIKELRETLTIANFAQKAADLSDDPTAIENNGDLGWMSPGDLVPEFEEAALALQVGQISEPVETDFGFHLIYKRDQRPYQETTMHAIFFDKQTATDILPTPELWTPSGLGGAQVVDAQVTFTQTNQPQVLITFDNEGAEQFAQLTQEYLGQQIAIYIDGAPISVPTVQNVISNGQAVITGSGNADEARNLARGLKDGALPVEIELIQQQTIGATLGQESLEKSLKAGMIGLLIVAIFMIIYYRLLGLVAVLALGSYGLIALMVFKTIPVTLTLSGIAGFILSIGMAVDANVLVFERFREEREKGKNVKDSIDEAFDRAWSSIRDGNVSTLITCFILAWVGTSLVKGFAITLGIGVLLSMFSAVVITRNLLRLLTAWPIAKLKIAFGSGWRLKG